MELIWSKKEASIMRLEIKPVMFLMAQSNLMTRNVAIYSSNSHILYFFIKHFTVFVQFHTFSKVSKDLSLFKD